MSRRNREPRERSRARRTYSFGDLGREPIFSYQPPVEGEWSLGTLIDRQEFPAGVDLASGDLVTVTHTVTSEGPPATVATARPEQPAITAEQIHALYRDAVALRPEDFGARWIAADRPTLVVPSSDEMDALSGALAGMPVVTDPNMPEGQILFASNLQVGNPRQSFRLTGIESTPMLGGGHRDTPESMRTAAVTSAVFPGWQPYYVMPALESWTVTEQPAEPVPEPIPMGKRCIRGGD